MQPNPRAEPGFVVAFGKIVKRIAEALTETPESELPIKMFVFGGAAVHLYPKFALEIFWVNFRQNLPAPKKSLTRILGYTPAWAPFVRGLMRPVGV